jgi:hypothetical protein
VSEPIQRIPTYVLGLAGEYFVAAELSRWGYQVSITYGAAKRVDLQVVNRSNRRLLWIETKTTQNYRPESTRSGKPVIEHAQWPINPREDAEGEDFYVFVLLSPKSSIPPRYFVCIRKEVIEAYQVGVSEYNVRRREAGKSDYDKVGVPTVALRHIQGHENRWDKIVGVLEHAD